MFRGFVSTDIDGDKMGLPVRPDQAWWLPPGTIRATLALIAMVGYCAGVVDLEVVTLIVGFYFGAKVVTNGEKKP